MLLRIQRLLLLLQLRSRPSLSLSVLRVPGPYHRRGAFHSGTSAVATGSTLPVADPTVRICNSNSKEISGFDGTGMPDGASGADSGVVPSVLSPDPFTCSHVNAPQNGRQTDSDDERGQGDAHCHFSRHTNDDDLSAGPTLVLSGNHRTQWGSVGRRCRATRRGAVSRRAVAYSNKTSRKKRNRRLVFMFHSRQTITTRRK